MNIDRKLATVRLVSGLETIEGADRIELATVDGWQVVVKKGEFEVGDPAIYFEIDSWVPHNIAPFLTKPGHEPKAYEGVPGQRLKTMRMKGQLSQGLLLPPPPVCTKEFPAENLLEGDDLTELLGIKKWERQIPAQLAGSAKGNFPTFLRKTDQERIQNVFRRVEHYPGMFELTEKLDGSSMIVNDFGDVVNKNGVRPPKKVEFQIEKKCITCEIADSKGRNRCFACGGWWPKPELVPKGWIREPGPRVVILAED